MATLIKRRTFGLEKITLIQCGNDAAAEETWRQKERI